MRNWKISSSLQLCQKKKYKYSWKRWDAIRDAYTTLRNILTYYIISFCSIITRKPVVKDSHSNKMLDLLVEKLKDKLVFTAMSKEKIQIFVILFNLKRTSLLDNTQIQNIHSDTGGTSLIQSTAYLLHTSFILYIQQYFLTVLYTRTSCIPEDVYNIEEINIRGPCSSSFWL